MNTNYAGFWLRFVAVIIDGLLLGAVQFIAIMPILGIMGIGLPTDIQSLESADETNMIPMVSQMMAMAGVTQIVFLTIQTLYYSFMESSKYQASIGKMVLGLKVTDVNGSPLDFTKALVRNLCKIISSMILMIGYLMAAFTEKKQALHDMIASTLVVKK
jgi:uncharacterized RDD family membrane protein YckC